LRAVRRGRAALLLFFLACNRPRAGPLGPAPQRIVSLTPSVTELLAEVGALPLVVGVDQFSAYPPEVRTLPKVGDFLSPNLDAILSLHPDLVLADEVQASVIQTLGSMGIRTIGLPMQTLEDVRAGLIRIGEEVGRPREGDQARARLDARLAAVAEKAARAHAATGRRPRVLFVVDRQVGGLGSMVAAGPGTYLDDLVVRLGAENVLADSPVRYAKISVEEVLTRAPDVILDAVHTGDARRARADWDALDTVPAVRAGRVHILGDTLFVSPGPRLAEVLERLVPLVWPGS
jgi:iron complex transport system substrate-binding protein